MSDMIATMILGIIVLIGWWLSFDSEIEEMFPLEGESKDRRKFFLKKNLLFEQRQTTKTIQVACIGCRSFIEVTVSKRGYRKWLNGTPIQDALPEVPAEKRELLISDVCEKCWKSIYGKNRREE